jgi:hypothetical protein
MDAVRRRVGFRKVDAEDCSPGASVLRLLLPASMYLPSPRMKRIVLLTISNIFMNLAWYGHLKFKNQGLWLVILAGWALAFFEYCFQVPTSRIGSSEWTVPQLKVLQECITLIVFTLVAFVLFHSPLRWNYAVSYAFIVAAVFFAFKF